jgi:D-glycero-D-manno-heptose 1,7-bisphosphate phosphatase
MGIHPLNPPAARAVFLDRDGVLNRALVRDGKPYPPASVAEMEIVPEAASALTALRDAGFLLLVVTNQPDVARARQSAEAVHQIHAALQKQLPLDGFYTCFHDDADHCDCRKPKPGLLLQAASEHNIDLPRSFLIGDRWRDIDAAHAAGCRAVWIDFQYREKGPGRPPAARVGSLAEASAWILSAGTQED